MATVTKFYASRLNRIVQVSVEQDITEIGETRLHESREEAEIDLMVKDVRQSYPDMSRAEALDHVRATIEVGMIVGDDDLASAYRKVVFSSHDSAPKRVEYFGRRVIVTETLLEGTDPLGLREVTYLWLDDADERNGGHPAGTRTRKVIKGDGRKKNFQVIEPETVVSYG